MTNIERFIVSAQPTLLRPLLDILATDPEVAVISVANNTRADPERLVVAMDRLRADALSTALGNRVLIEPDEEIQLI